MKIHIEPKRGQKAEKTFTSIYQAATHLSCSKQTLEKAARKYQCKEFYAVNLETNAKCFFRKSKHNDKLELKFLPNEDATGKTYKITIDEPPPVMRNTTKAAKHLEVTAVALYAKKLTSGVWLVKNKLNNKQCLLYI